MCRNPEGMDRQLRRKSLDALNDLNQMQAQELGNPETLTRIAQYELAYRMQTSVPAVMDISQEPKHIIDAYGAEPVDQVLPTTVFWQDDWLRKAYDSYICLIGDGTFMERTHSKIFGMV